MDIVENHPRRQPLYRQRVNLGIAWYHAKSDLPPRHNVGVVLDPHPKRSTLLFEITQQNRSTQVSSTLSPYQWQLRSWKLNVRSVHLPIWELLCWKRATPMATCLSRQTDANNTLYTKVFPDPPRPSRKNIAPSPWTTMLNTAVIVVS